MPTEYCRKCRARIVTSHNNTDVIHECNSGNDAIDYEDVLITGSWEDYSGSGARTKFEVTHAGLQSENAGTNAQWLGQKQSGKTLRGNNDYTTRQRKRLSYIKLNI